MNELTKTNQNLTKKEALGQYVHDMVDLEIRAFSLRKTAEETRKEAEIKENNAKSNLIYCNKEKENAFCRWQYKHEHREIDEAAFWRDHTGGLIAALFFGLPTLAAGIFNLCAGEGGIGLTIIGSVIIGIYFCYLIADFNSRSKQQARYIISLKEQYEQTIKNFEKSVENSEQTKLYVQTLCSHADQLDKDIAEIETTLQKNYALNIIPPDYRRLECLVWIDYAFRNDQVDTMREATLQCDKWVRHQDTMEALKDLAKNIRSVAVLLENMDSNISMMNQDLFRIAEAQEKQLSESQSARYAMESVQKSTERLAMYEDMKRAGTF